MVDMPRPDISNIPDGSNYTLNELHEMGVYPVIETPKRIHEAVHNELKADGRMFAAESKVTWDKYDLEIKIKIPMVFSEVRTMEVFQSILDDVIRIMRSETEGGLLRF